MAHWLAFSMHRMDDLIFLQEQLWLAGYLNKKNIANKHSKKTNNI